MIFQLLVHQFWSCMYLNSIYMFLLFNRLIMFMWLPVVYQSVNADCQNCVAICYVHAWYIWCHSTWHSLCDTYLDGTHSKSGGVGGGGGGGLFPYLGMVGCFHSDYPVFEIFDAIGSLFYANSIWFPPPPAEKISLSRSHFAWDTLT